MARREQLVGDVGMAVHLRKLEHFRPVPIELQPAHPVENRINRALCGSRAVGIFDPQQEFAAKMPCIQPVEQRRSRAADMEITGRRRRKAGHDSFGACAHADFLQRCVRDGHDVCDDIRKRP